MFSKGLCRCRPSSYLCHATPPRTAPGGWVSVSELESTSQSHGRGREARGIRAALSHWAIKINKVNACSAATSVCVCLCVHQCVCACMFVPPTPRACVAHLARAEAINWTQLVHFGFGFFGVFAVASPAARPYLYSSCLPLYLMPAPCLPLLSLAMSPVRDSCFTWVHKFKFNNNLATGRRTES